MISSSQSSKEKASRFRKCSGKETRLSRRQDRDRARRAASPSLSLSPRVFTSEGGTPTVIERHSRDESICGVTKRGLSASVVTSPATATGSRNTSGKRCPIATTKDLSATEHCFRDSAREDCYIDGGKLNKARRTGENEEAT